MCSRRCQNSQVKRCAAGFANQHILLKYNTADCRILLFIVPLINATINRFEYLRDGPAVDCCVCRLVPPSSSGSCMMLCEPQAPHPADCWVMIAVASSVVAAAMKGGRHVVASTEGCGSVCQRLIDALLSEPFQTNFE